MSDSKALTLRERQVAVIHKRRDQIVGRARRLLGYAGDAPELTTNGGQAPDAWKARRDWRVREQVARDANLSKRHAPVYLEIQQRIVENAEKLELIKSHGAPVALNVAYVTVVQGAPSYPEIVVDAKETPR
ncbi:MAG: hypothetical protein M3Q61_05525 [Chloroflexota bacterium]|nr:hypothetical protein [Chloroflexota bacterium]